MKKAISILTTVVMLVSITSVSAKATLQSNPPDFETGQLSQKLTKDMNGVYQYFKSTLNTTKSVSKPKIEDPVNELSQLKSSEDNLGFTHIKTQQTVKGIPVYGHEYIIHFNKNGEVYATNGSFDNSAKNAKFKSSNFIGENKALEIATNQVKFDKLEVPPTSKLYLYKYESEYIPVYIVTLNYISPELADWKFFIHAENGSIIKQLNSIQSVSAAGTGIGVLGDSKTLQLNKATVSGKTQYQLNDSSRGINIATYSCNNGTTLPGSLVYSSTTTITDKAAVDAHYYAGKVYDYYKDKFNRNSIDGKGMAIKSSVHYLKNYVNAAWTANQMIYGDGNKINSVELSGGLDVIGHEMTHGVNQNEANLEYEYQSGALNESFSDSFGAFIEYYAQKSKFDWLLGEDIWTPAIAGDALRSLSDPTKYGQPDNMSKFVVLPNTKAGDWGGVHTNSGIPNKACYLTTTNSSVGVNKAEQIYYRALTSYLTISSNFHDARMALIQSATDLYGATGPEVTAIKSAWDAVGIN